MMDMPDFLTKQDCHAMAAKLGIKRPVMYDIGYNNNKKSVVRPTVRKSAFMRFISMIRKAITNKRTVEKKGDK